MVDATGEVAQPAAVVGLAAVVTVVLVVEMMVVDTVVVEAAVVVVVIRISTLSALDILPSG